MEGATPALLFLLINVARAPTPAETWVLSAMPYAAGAALVLKMALAGAQALPGGLILTRTTHC
jgi:hypothetical protein